ncbi:MAG: M28 family peptidase [Candidatus Limiplasma sp.]|nr:M28 family peptidase [Candidatus Limiplasma sp.]
MDFLSYLQEAAAKHGPSGHEGEVSAWLAERFRPLCDQVDIDPLYNVIALKKATRTGSNPAPKVLLCAHQDEIALMVADILPDGTLRMGQVGGVDPRILPASTVTVHGRLEGGDSQQLLGVVGAKPPHLLDEAERKQNYKREDLFVDVGLPVEKVRALVHIGDSITLNGETRELLNRRAAGKTMDDRACVGVLLDVAERMQNMTHEADLYFACTSQEEVGARGAKVAAYTVDPDMAIVLDVSHAPVPQSKPDTTIPLDSPAAVQGPFLQYKLLARLKEVAGKHGVKLNTELEEGATHTDTDAVQIAREGVPCLCLSLPLKYMHTTVELLDMNAMAECGRLVAHFLAEMTQGWEDELWN